MRRGKWLWVPALALAVGLVGSAPKKEAVIDFSGLAAGEIVDTLSAGAGFTGDLGGTIGVHGFNPRLSVADNAAVVFDTGNPPGTDFDLGSPNEDFGGPGKDKDGDPTTGGNAGSQFENDTFLGNVLIVNEHLLLVDRDGDGVITSFDSPAEQPNDADHKGQFLEFDFSSTSDGVVTVNGITYMDVDLLEGENGARLEMYGPSLPAEGEMIALPPVGDNGVNTIDGIGLDGVSRMRLVLNGSGAMASAVLQGRVRRPCWVTTGGFFNAGVTSGQKTCTFGGNIGPPPSGAFEVNFHSGPYDGFKFHTNDIEIVECVDSGSTGPGQPGGKKGLQVDTAIFDCTGRLNNEDGFTCEGRLVDGGEPAGKNGNDPDRIEMIVRDGDGNVAAECVGELDGGNVQIHPPVGPGSK